MGSLYTWGRGKSSLLGHGDYKDKKDPTPIANFTRAKMVSMGTNHAAAIVNGAVYLWGDSTYGQLGRGYARQLAPLPIIWKKKIMHVACGQTHTIMCSDEGEVYSMGDNEFGQLGFGNLEGVCVPIQVECPGKPKVIKVAAGNGVSAAVSDRGVMMTWGRGDTGQLGNGQRVPIVSRPSPVSPPQMTSPIIFLDRPSIEWLMVQFGAMHTVALSREGTIYTWGNNSQGQLGLGHHTDSLIPVRVPVGDGDIRMTLVASGNFHSGAVGEDGRVYMWGANAFGQAGTGTLSSEQLPTIVLGPLRDKCAIQLALGCLHSVVLTAEGEIYTFGQGEYYQLGHADKKARLWPSIMLPTMGAVTGIVAGGDASGLLLSAGAPLNGTLGQETKTVKEEATPYNVYIASWNCNGKRPESLADWLGGAQNADVLIVGIQEMVKMAAGSVVRAQAAQSTNPEAVDTLPWVIDIDRFVGPMRYVKVFCKALVGVLLVAYVKDEHRPHVRNIQSALAPCGAMGMIGNKGAVVIRFSLYATQMCFVCSHLAAGPSRERLDKRYQDYKSIIQKIHFGNINSTGTGDNQAESTIFDHENVFWFGDLNYRIPLANDQIRKMVADKDYEPLLRADQLIAEQAAGRVFQGFKEGPIDFAPTYAYDVNTQNYDTGEKHRSPAWCDRVLWRGEDIRLTSYARHELLDSDHRPITASFVVPVRRPEASPYASMRVSMKFPSSPQPIAGSPSSKSAIWSASSSPSRSVLSVSSPVGSPTLTAPSSSSEQSPAGSSSPVFTHRLTFSSPYFNSHRPASPTARDGDRLASPTTTTTTAGTPVVAPTPTIPTARPVSSQPPKYTPPSPTLGSAASSFLRAQANARGRTATVADGPGPPSYSSPRSPSSFSSKSSVSASPLSLSTSSLAPPSLTISANTPTSTSTLPTPTPTGISASSTSPAAASSAPSARFMYGPVVRKNSDEARLQRYATTPSASTTPSPHVTLSSYGRPMSVNYRTSTPFTPDFTQPASYTSPTLLSTHTPSPATIEPSAPPPRGVPPRVAVAPVARSETSPDLRGGSFLSQHRGGPGPSSKEQHTRPPFRG
eukprot:TRINITY_DN5001_c0_g1_i4.p1 TRINITY_DN5001_c0_g1~~TRINITY_DN5001_c0_g1_i4.p1  ORF type:complete len:1079 (-),score=249.45 TRINITY_DN5001_c0_g1_i4:68-3304(-)